MPRIIECNSKTLHLRACAFGDGVHFNGCILTGNILVFYDGMASGEKNILRYTIEKDMEATANMNISLLIYEVLDEHNTTNQSLNIRLKNLSSVSITKDNKKKYIFSQVLRRRCASKKHIVIRKCAGCNSFMSAAENAIGVSKKACFLRC